MQTLSSRGRETERLALLASVHLSTESEPRFNELIELAAFVAHTPMAGITIIEAETAWFKASLGFSPEPVDRLSVPCNLVAQEACPLVITDIAEDERFADSSAIAQLGMRFYAGFPLLVDDGIAVGTLCVLDRRPRRLLSDERHALQVIAGQAATQLRVNRLKALLSTC